MKKIYQFLYSKIGLIIVIALYFILPLPLTLSYNIILDAIGESVGELIPPFIVIFVLSRYFKWNRNQKILHAFIIAFLFQTMMSQRLLIPIVNLISITAILIFIVQIIIETFRKKKPAKS